MTQCVFPRNRKFLIGVLLAGIFLTGLPGCHSKEIGGIGGAYAPQVAVQQEDYAQARRAFHTHLVVQEASPQPWDPATPPAGVTEITFPSVDLHLKAWINRPPNTTIHKSPAVLFLHGGFAFGADDWAMSQPYRDAGYIVMTPMLRGENGLPGNFSLFYDELDDVLAAAEYLSRQPYVDAKHLYVAGHSAGGTLALLAALASSRFRAAASFSGSPDQILFCKYSWRDVPFDSSDPREYQMRSPLAYAASFKCPVRLYYGSQESFFAATTPRTAEIAKEHHLDVAAVQVEGDHFSAVPEEMRQSIVFFQQRK